MCIFSFFSSSSDKFRFLSAIPLCLMYSRSLFVPDFVR